MGLRGPKPNPATRRDEIVKLRLHTSELTQLQDAAEKARMSVSEHIRKRCKLRLRAET